MLVRIIVDGQGTPMKIWLSTLLCLNVNGSVFVWIVSMVQKNDEFYSVGVFCGDVSSASLNSQICNLSWYLMQ